MDVDAPLMTATWKMTTRRHKAEGQIVPFSVSQSPDA